MNTISQLGLDSWVGVLSFILTVVLSIGPFLWKSHKKHKKAAAGLTQSKMLLNKGANLHVIGDAKYWVETEAKILSFNFAEGLVPVSKKIFKKNKSAISNPLLAVVEFITIAKVPVRAQVFIGDEVYDEGEMLKIRYNPQRPEQAIFVV